jgi:hypothetical protein
MIFEQYLGWFVLFAVFAAIFYGMRTQRQDIARRARKMALGEAAAALQSLADVADKTSRVREDEGSGDAAQAAYERGYYYGRAARMVRSIPVDRL